MQPGEQLLSGIGESVTVGSHTPFPLLRGSCWYLRSGAVDIFSERSVGDTAAGHRRHVLRAEGGQLILGISNGTRPRPLRLIGVGTNGTELIRAQTGDLERLLEDPGARDPLTRLLDDWIEQVFAVMATGLLPDDCQELEAGAYQASEQTLVRSAGGPLWIQHKAGSSRFLGLDYLEIDGGGLMPISRQVWLQVAPGSELQAHETAVVAERPAIWQGLERLHELFLDFIVRAVELEGAAERLRMRQRAIDDRRSFRRACLRIAETLRGPSAEAAVAAEAVDAEEAAGEPSRDLLFAACRQVGRHLRIKVRGLTPKEGEEALADPLGEIARRSRFRIRQVLLKDDWWREDGGPFLAFAAETAKPLALLPASPTRYFVHDPSTRRRQVVTAAVAEGIEPRAYTFYRPFPDRPVGLLQLVRFGLRGSWRDLSAMLAMAAAGGLLSLMVPIATRAIFNDFIPGASRSGILQICLVLMAFAVAGALFQLAGALSLLRIEGRLSAALQTAVWDRLLALPVPFFRPYTAGDLASRAMSVEGMRQVLSSGAVGAVLSGVFSLFHFGLMFIYSPELAWRATLLIALAVAATALAGRLQLTSERLVAAVRNKLAGVVLQFLTSIAKLQVSGAEVRAFAQWARDFSRQRRYQFRSRSVANAMLTVRVGLPLISGVVLYAAGARLAAEGALRTGDFLAFMVAFSTCLTGMLMASGALVATAPVVTLYEQARPILRALPEVDTSKADPGTLRGDIEIYHLSFRYNDDGPLVLRDVSMHVRPGEFAALVGTSGSGKSTLLRLLLGFETPEVGTIYYDRQELEGLDRQAVRGQIGVVLQNGRLTSGDIFSNIIGSTPASLEDAWQAARMAGLDTDIEAMPMGMHTVVSEGGSTLSGGQRQRLMIARALVRKPRILFLDEATSALDNRTQAIVSESLDRLKATRIVVAHRLSTIQHADCIYVLDRGEVVEKGSLDELLDQGGIFAELARRQIA